MHDNDGIENTVLLVDDDPTLLQSLRRVMRREPFEIVTAPGAIEALELLTKQEVHVVVSDEKMPRMRGNEFLTEVRRLYPDTARIMLTGEASLETAVTAINSGEIFRFHTKPCAPAELASTIKQAFRHREMLVQGRRLLETVRAQGAVIDDIEALHPGITRVERNADGAIVIEEQAQNLDEFLAQVNRELERRERRLAPTW